MSAHHRAYKYMFQVETEALAFLIGLSIRHNLLPPKLTSRWKKFILDDMAKVYSALSTT